jgi:signal peptidase II
MRGGVEIKKKLQILAATAVTLVILDQATKHLVTSRLRLNEVIEVVPGLFNIVLFRNPGAAFSAFSTGGLFRTLFLIAVSVAALVIIAVLIRQSKDALMSFALSMIAAGAMGNLIDRVRYGSVIDFIDLYAGGYHWPAFNVADSAITVGVILAIFSYYFRSPEP